MGPKMKVAAGLNIYVTASQGPSGSKLEHVYLYIFILQGRLACPLMCWP
jgi:hypothetical protein